MIADNIRKEVEKVLKELDLEQVEFTVEHPADTSHGDYATNVALVLGKKLGKNPKELAEALQLALLAQDDLNFVDKIEVAGAGFINFYLSPEFFAKSLELQDDFGKNNELKGTKVMVEYTDPNPFKELHIGHLMSNAIGESISRLIEYSGADVKRANYQGDVGMHVAKAIWGKMKKPESTWGDAYAYGATEYDSHKDEITTLNKKVYEKSDEEINALWEEGKKTSLESFEEIYTKLGTQFDEYFFESEVAEKGKKIVEENTGDVFEESDGAIIYKGEQDGLHTRVFLNSEGLPTYEAKELALPVEKYSRYKYDTSIVVTGNEINEYFKVLMSALGKINPELAGKTRHIAHGMLRLPSGKMSSRTGDVITAMALIEIAKEKALEKMEEKDERIAEQVAIGAIKYAILKQTPGKDIIFDIDQSLSLEGDSGPYLQYTYVRALSVLKKAQELNIKPNIKNPITKISQVERLLYRLPEVILSASRDYAPHTVVHFLTALAGSFNTLYAQEKIVDENNEYTPYRLALTQALATTLKNGLYVLGIPTPDHM